MSVVAPCPFCGSLKMTWTVPAFSNRVTPECEECGATGPSGLAPSRTDREAITAAALSAWNSRAEV